MPVLSPNLLSSAYPSWLRSIYRRNQCTRLRRSSSRQFCAHPRGKCITRLSTIFRTHLWPTNGPELAVYANTIGRSGCGVKGCVKWFIKGVTVPIVLVPVTPRRQVIVSDRLQPCAVQPPPARSPQCFTYNLLIRYTTVVYYRSFPCTFFLFQALHGPKNSPEATGSPIDPTGHHRQHGSHAL